MPEIYIRKSNILSEYKYIWVLDYYTNQRYINFIYYYKILTNYNLVIKNNIYFIQYIFNNKRYKLKFLKNKIFEKIFTPIKISLRLIGLGYKIIYITNQIFLLYIGYSYNLYIYLPSEVLYSINIEGNYITLVSTNRELLTNIIYKLKQLKKPNPYKESGFKFMSDIFVSKSYKK